MAGLGRSGSVASVLLVLLGELELDAARFSRWPSALGACTPPATEAEAVRTDCGIVGGGPLSACVLLLSGLLGLRGTLLLR